jgi:hypothetical protein
MADPSEADFDKFDRHIAEAEARITRQAALIAALRSGSCGISRAQRLRCLRGAPDKANVTCSGPADRPRSLRMARCSLAGTHGGLRDGIAEAGHSGAGREQPARQR